MEANKVLDTSALIQGIRGLTTIFSAVEYPRGVKGCDVILPTLIDYCRAIEISRILYQKGTPVPATDILIASIALNRNLILVTKDKHFEKIPELKLEFVE